MYKNVKNTGLKFVPRMYNSLSLSLVVQCSHLVSAGGLNSLHTMLKMAVVSKLTNCFLFVLLQVLGMLFVYFLLLLHFPLFSVIVLQNIYIPNINL